MSTDEQQQQQQRLKQQQQHQAASAACAILRCGARVSGIGEFCRLPLCRRHLRNEEAKRKELEVLRRHRHDLHSVHQRILTELEQTRNSFQSVRDVLDRWETSITDELLRRNEIVSESIQDFSKADNFEEQLQEATKSGDAAATFEILASLDKTVDLLKEDYLFYRTAEGCRSSAERMVAEAAFGDVDASVKELQFVVDQRLTKMTLDTKLESLVGLQVKPKPEAATLRNLVPNLGGGFAFIDVCRNTDGYHANLETNEVVRVGVVGVFEEEEEKQAASTPLPPLVVFAATADGSIKHLVVTSLDKDDDQKFKCVCRINWDLGVSGLHCDSDRQVLYIAQPASVSVVDLAGNVVRVVADAFGGAADLRGICGNCDKYFVFDKKQKRIVAVSKEKDDFEFDITNSAFTANTNFRFMTVVDHKVILSDNKMVHTVCYINKHLLTSHPTGTCPQFSCPSGIAVSSKGLLFISDCSRHSVRVLLHDGTLVQTLGTDGTAGSASGSLNYPSGLSIVSVGHEELLVVSDWNNVRLCVYSLL